MHSPIIKTLVSVLASIFTAFTIFDNCYAKQELAETVANIKPSIVAIGTYLPKRNPRAVFLGTGFAVANGSLVVTNAHVLPDKLDYEHLEQVGVFYRQSDDDHIIIATVVVIDKDHDLAILKLKEGQLTPLKLGNALSVREGQEYAFTGYPIGMVLGLYPVTHRGIISAISPIVIPAIHSGSINQKMLQRLHDPYNVFQLDATAYPGNSGSPLYNTVTGEVIGVINKVFVQESKENLLSHPSGISYAIPIDHVEKLLKVKELK
ncbi:MAG: trypsin-like peptidase domain-containing protein [Methylococcaceae bacterium]|nr:trypsin-like peptidase domain-containing protein [Methylococcaceae bacterium]